MTVRGVSAGRIVFELFADTIYGYPELFRTLCTGEKGVSQTSKPLHFKGTDIRLFSTDDYITGGNLGNMTSDEAQSIYGDLKPVASHVVIGKVIQGIEVLHEMKIAFSNQPPCFLDIKEMVIANSEKLIVYLTYMD
ncbi:hypothetical protein QQ045_017045 [Rhodiola kirilowii]